MLPDSAVRGELGLMLYDLHSLSELEHALNSCDVYAFFCLIHFQKSGVAEMDQLKPDWEIN